MCALLLCVAAGRAPAQQRAAATINAGPPQNQHIRFSVIASSSALADVNHDDAKAAIQTWFDLAAKQRGLLVESNIDILESVREIRGRLENHSVEMLILTTVDFLELEDSHLAVPILTHALTSRGVAPYSYLLLAGPSSPATTIAGLRGKNVLVSSRGGSNTASVWLEVLLSKENLGRAASFFASSRKAEKAQDCILKLFFGKVDACVVDEVNLNLAKELNPQIGQFRVLARSRPMIGSVIATSLEQTADENKMIDAVLALHTDPRGRQLLQLFKTERVVRIQPGDLDSARDLFADYHRLEVSARISPKGFGPAEKRPAAPQPEMQPPK
jgi:phosphonate transport system substrate-binding protein